MSSRTKFIIMLLIAALGVTIAVVSLGYLAARVGPQVAVAANQAVERQREIDAQNREQTELRSLSYNIERFIDLEAGVVCYARNDYRAGISCLPIEETRLDE